MLLRICLSLLCGVLLTLLYPPFSYAAIGWLALTPLIVALRGATPRQGLWLGWVAGTIGALGVTGYWMYHAANDYFALSPLAAALFTVAINQAFVSVYFMLFGLAATVRRKPRPLFLAALFVTIEYARAQLFSGNPWAQLGQSQDIPILMQVCDLTGIYGLSFLLAWTAAALADVRRSWRPLAAAALAVVLVLAYGSWRLQTSVHDAAVVPIGLVQGALPNVERGDPRFFARHLQTYLDLSAALDLPPQALLVWPENAVGFFPAENAPLLVAPREVLRVHDASLLFGAPRASGMEGVAAIFNSAYLLRASGLETVYDKRVLLPFVESTPLRRQDGPYLAGDHVGIFPLASTPTGVLICYEAIYAGLGTEVARNGAGVLVNLSNDSWFESGAGPEQHFQAAKFRAVENHMSLVRVTNSGVSAVVDPNGREILRLPSKQSVARLVAVPVGAGVSFYSLHGDVFAAACIVFVLVALGVQLITENKTRVGKAHPTVHSASRTV